MKFSTNPLTTMAFAAFAAALTLPLPAQDAPAPAIQIDANAFKPPPDLKAVKKPVNDKWKFTLLPVGLHKNPQIDYAIMGELTNEGRKLPEPSFDR